MGSGTPGPCNEQLDPHAEAKKAARNCGFLYAPGDLVSLTARNRDYKVLVTECVLRVGPGGRVRRSYILAAGMNFPEEVTEDAVGE